MSVPLPQIPSSKIPSFSPPADDNPDIKTINDKVSKVYLYVAAAFATTLATAYLCATMGLAASMISLLVGSQAWGLIFFAVDIGLLAATILTPKEDANKKQCLFYMFAMWQGLLLSPLALISPAVFALAGTTTAALMGGLGVLAMNLKESFEKYEKILSVALIAIAVASLGAVILPMGAAAFSHEVCLIGGLAVFGAFTIYDTHKARSQALKPAFDEINHAMGIYLDALNLMIRLWEIFKRNAKN